MFIVYVQRFDVMKKECKKLEFERHLRPCLDTKFTPKFHYAKRRFTITSKCRHIYGVLNVDEIKN
jgi:hypothetical protein